LYDLGRDLGEANNQAAQHPDVVARLTKLAAEIRSDTNIPPPPTP